MGTPNLDLLITKIDLLESLIRSKNIDLGKKVSYKFKSSGKAVSVLFIWEYRVGYTLENIVLFDRGYHAVSRSNLVSTYRKYNNPSVRSISKKKMVKRFSVADKTLDKAIDLIIFSQPEA